ncbi:hypothetical protein ES708_28170 [subsurface metagenome]
MGRQDFDVFGYLGYLPFQAGPAGRKVVYLGTQFLAGLLFTPQFFFLFRQLAQSGFRLLKLVFKLGQFLGGGFQLGDFALGQFVFGD